MAITVESVMLLKRRFLNLNSNSYSNSKLVMVAAIAGWGKVGGDLVPYLTHRPGQVKRGKDRSVDGLNLNGKVKDFGVCV